MKNLKNSKLFIPLTTTKNGEELNIRLQEPKSDIIGSATIRRTTTMTTAITTKTSATTTVLQGLSH